jgi:putative oxidoreductase
MLQNLAEPYTSVLILIARCCLAMLFLVSGVHKAMWYSKAVDEWNRCGVPRFTLPPTIFLHIVGSIAMITGLYAREAALALAVFLLLATIKVHHFWTMQGEERLNRSRTAMANLGVLGGLLLIAAVGPGQLIF